MPPIRQMLEVAQVARRLARPRRIAPALASASDRAEQRS